ERVARLNIRSPGRLHIASVEEGQSIESMWKRFLSVLSAAANEQRILDAWWENHDFVVMSPRFERLRVSLDQLRGLRFLADSSRQDLGQFEIDQDGSFIRWPELDVDLDWHGLCRLAGRTDARRAARMRQFRTEYGAAIRELREQRGLRQKDVEGLDERHVRRIEKGEVAATASALEKLARTHEMSLQDYLDELARLVEAD
ncbi:MAG: helix-turn-helix domain-containing protein, partial [Gaiellales bacterium]